MAQIDGLSPAIALKSSDLFMVNQNTSTEGPEVRLEQRLTLSDLMAYINTNFDPTNNTNSSYFNKKETITGTCTISAGPSGMTYSGDRYVGVSGILEPVLVRVSITNSNKSGYTYLSSGILIKGGYTAQRNDSAGFTFLGNGGLNVGIYNTTTSGVSLIPVLDMASIYSAPGDISYTVEVYHLKSSSGVTLTRYDAGITATLYGWLPEHAVFSTQKTTIEYPSTLPQTPDSDAVYML